MRIAIVPQIDGTTRLIAMTNRDARAVAQDPALIDAVKPLGVMDVDRDGTRWLGRAGPQPSEITADVRKALRAEAQSLAA